jgi:hypothetical protein
MEVPQDIKRDKSQDPADKDRVGPRRVESAKRAAGSPSEQRRASSVDVLQIIGNRPRIRDPSGAVDQHRHASLTGWRDCVFFREPPRNGLDGESLVCQRHPDAPAVGTEPPIGLGTREIVELHAHAGLTD